MTVKAVKGWVKIGETLYPIGIDDLEIGEVQIKYNADVPPNTTVSIDHPMQSTPEMSDNEAFDLMDSIRRERPWQS